VAWENRTSKTHTASRTANPTFNTGNILAGKRSDPPTPFSTPGNDLEYVSNGPGNLKGFITVVGANVPAQVGADANVPAQVGVGSKARPAKRKRGRRAR
jgi:hypothetical protein